MADYHSPTVVQPTIPIADMTPLERLLLTRIFEAEPDGDGLYFFAEIGPSDGFKLAVEDLRAAFIQSAGIASTASAYLAERMVDIGDSDTHVEIDLTGMSWEFIFQDIRPPFPDARPPHRRFGLHLYEDASRRIRRHGGADHRQCHQGQVDKRHPGGFPRGSGSRCTSCRVARSSPARRNIRQKRDRSSD